MRLHMALIMAALFVLSSCGGGGKEAGGSKKTGDAKAAGKAGKTSPDKPADPAAGKTPEERAAAEEHFRKGRALVEEKDWAGAAVEFEKARPFYDEDPHFAYDLGKAYENLFYASNKLEELTECIRNYEKLLKLKPEVANQAFGPSTVGKYVAWLKEKEKTLKEGGSGD